ncbi:hypothetical protein [Candidatus Nitrosarchaeum limnium]|uniref:Uncharacterized protein n=1 Tax=Candidatus Nitrosarchaeum limnium BG20 TaxID=859192 RepID=S2E4W9_9ARCH|nr:hypothetical protein [Candidatus Nitrosarchaeum limnium]EPA06260.1 hypothetical protein BG20_I2001 [Candidatus Nitrosarchaeum limnium BG20]
MIQIKNLFLLSVLLASSISIISNYAYAESSPNSISWQLTFITDKSSCNFSEETKIKEIENIVKRYFQLYKMNDSLLESNCVLSGQYFSNSNSNDVNLNIIVLDEVIGNQLMMRYGYEGLYAHYGADRTSNHAIIISSHSQYSSAFDNTEFPWLLSHELSHFILSHKGHNVESIERMLHADKLQYNDCISDFSERCTDIKSTITSNVSGQKFNVMSPLKQVVNQNSMSYLSDDLYSSYAVKKLLHQITGWWINGIIDDKFYLDALKQIVDVPITKNKVAKTTQLSISNGFSILDEIKKGKNNEKILKNPAKMYDVLKFIPFDTHSIKSESKSPIIPSWYKNRAMLWQNEKLEDRIFLDGVDAIVRNGLIQEN